MLQFLQIYVDYRKDIEASESHTLINPVRHKSEGLKHNIEIRFQHDAKHENHWQF